MTVWSAVFIGLSSVDGVGDNHPGHRVPFWQRACQEERPGGCATLGLFVSTYCQDGSGWACNELGVLRTERVVNSAGEASADFTRSCELGFTVGCQNMAMLVAGSGSGALRRAPPQVADYPLILRAGKGALRDRTPLELVSRACDQGWMEGCQRLGFAHLRGEGTPRDPLRAAALFDQACEGGLGAACSDLGYMYRSADGVARDEERSIGYLKKACTMGFASACRWLEEETQ
jgi:TPR repeat protein